MSHEIQNGKSVALVLSSGGARGIAHIGVIEELIERGYHITSVSGASMGSLVGGIYAAAYDRGIEAFKEWLLVIDKKKMFDLLDFSFSLDGLVKGERLVKTLTRLIPDRYIEDLHIPFNAVATDILTGDEVVFDRGKLFDAIRASISIPSVFKPYKLNNRLLVDGAVSNPLPLSRVVRHPGDIVIAVDVCAPSENPPKKTDMNYYSLLAHTTNIMIQKLTATQVEKYRPDILINIPYDTYNVMEFYKSHELIEMGRKKAVQALDIFSKEALLIK